MLPGIISLPGLSAPTGSGNDSFTKLLLHADGSNGSTSFPDSSAANKTVTVAQAGATVSTTQSMFGGASANFNGAGQLTVPLDSDLTFGTGDFTIDFWLNSAGGTPLELGNYGGFDGVFIQGSGTTIYTYINRGTAQSLTITANTWTHIAVVRSGSTAYGFKDGVQQWSIANSSNIAGTGGLSVGCSNWTGSDFLTGYIDELRISKGIARWTAGFTPPSSPYS
jgi:hypothetical protein